jgi:hypothetical protein
MNQVQATQPEHPLPWRKAAPLLLAAQVVVVLDASIGNVSLPAIQHALRLSEIVGFGLLSLAPGLPQNSSELIGFRVAQGTMAAARVSRSRRASAGRHPAAPEPPSNPPAQHPRRRPGHLEGTRSVPRNLKVPSNASPARRDPRSALLK